jgi:DNA-binding NtrC family response regulator
VTTRTETGAARPTSIVYEKGQPAELVVKREEIVVISGPDEGSKVALDRDVVRVGSAKENDLVLTDRTVSRHHCELRRTPAGWEVHDLGSTNGTAYAGSRLHAAVIPLGAVIDVGKTKVELREVTERRRVPLSRRTRFGDLVGESPAMRRVFSLLERAAESDVTVLLEGETGTGKELAARALHQHSRRASSPFVVVDCGAVSGSLIQSELFGHAKGSFTSADRDREGAFEAAHGGTLFLDEIGELPLELQPMLLRVLELREVRRIGETASRPVDVRLVAASNRELPTEVREGRFREDLFYRVGVLRIRMPALRERREDIPTLVKHFLRSRPGIEISDSILHRLGRAPWPGNIRELRNVVERGVLLSFDEVAQGAGEGLEPAPTSTTPKVSLDIPFKEAKEGLVGAFEREYLQALLKRTAGNVSRAAREAGIDRKHLERLMKKHRIRRR